MNKWIKKEAAFTLIELLVAIAIISILAALAIPSYQEYRVRAFDRDAKSNLRNAITALESYYTDNTKALGTHLKPSGVTSQNLTRLRETFVRSKSH